MRLLLGSGLATVAALGLAAQVAGQETARAPGGQRLTGSLSQTIGADTNFRLEDPSEDASVRSTTTLGFAYEAETQIDSFRLDGAVSLLGRVGGAAEGQDDTDLDVALPGVRGRYTREAARARLTLGARVAAQPVEYLRGLAVEVDEDGDIVASDVEEDQETGVRFVYGGDVGLTFNQGGPAALRLEAAANVIDYTDVDDDQLVPNRRLSAGVGTDLRLAPTLLGSVDLDVSLFEADDDDETVRRRAGAGLGLAYEADQRTVFRLRGGVAVEEQETVAGTDTATLFSGGAGIGYALPRGTVNLDVGLATTSDDEVATTAALRLRRELPGDATLAATLDRSLSLSDGGEDLTVTAARLSVTVPVDPLSQAAFGADYVLREELDADEPDESRLTLSAEYSRALSRRLTLTAGYAYSLRDEGPEQAQNHGVELGLRVPLDF